MECVKMAVDVGLKEEILENRRYIVQLIERVARLEERSRITYMLWGALGGTSSTLLIALILFVLTGG